jgi:hypothetical protein
VNIRDTIKRILAGPEPVQIPDLGRNDLCWCGSGRKYKSCHLSADDRKRAAARTSTGSQQPLTRGF